MVTAGKLQSTNTNMSAIEEIKAVLSVKMQQKNQRVQHVNEVIRIIADHGRRFFYTASSQSYASMHIDKYGKIWFVDNYSGKRILTHETTWGGRWKGFSGGGTLRALVEAFRDYIRTGVNLNPGYLGPERFDDSNIWGYDEECMQAVREQAGVLPVFTQPPSQVQLQDQKGLNNEP